MPQEGLYKLELFGKPLGAEGSYHRLCWGYHLACTAPDSPAADAQQRFLGFAEINEPYLSQGASVVSPAEPRISRTTPTPFSVQFGAADDDVMTVIVRSEIQWAELVPHATGPDRIWTATFVPRSSYVEVLAIDRSNPHRVSVVCRWGKQENSQRVFISPMIAISGVRLHALPVLDGQPPAPHDLQSLWLESPPSSPLMVVMQTEQGKQLDDRTLIQYVSGTCPVQFLLEASFPCEGDYVLKLYMHKDTGPCPNILTLPIRGYAGLHVPVPAPLTDRYLFSSNLLCSYCPPTSVYPHPHVSITTPPCPCTLTHP